MALYTLHMGRVGSGFQMASGGSVGDPKNPFSKGTIALQYPYLKLRGLDLEAEIPGLHWGTVNIELAHELLMLNPDFPVDQLDWASEEPNPEARVAPEDFWFARCGVGYAGRFYSGLIYYPHPRTKPSTNAHNYAVIEVLTQRIEGLTKGEPISVHCRSDVFGPRPA
uniref:hypothetical protein n=1 Tax=uncultured Caulobacter sp. TaxID=158749 RepID=UPI0025DF90A2|nr:hypothetical protein [uncultured Caulobacter sp.]